jgi:hypothetical protein
LGEDKDILGEEELKLQDFKIISFLLKISIFLKVMGNYIMSRDLFMEVWSDAFHSIPKCFMKSYQGLSMTLGLYFLLILLFSSSMRCSVVFLILVVLNIEFLCLMNIICCCS